MLWLVSMFFIPQKINTQDFWWIICQEQNTLHNFLPEILDESSFHSEIEYWKYLREFSNFETDKSTFRIYENTKTFKISQKDYDNINKEEKTFFWPKKILGNFFLRFAEVRNHYSIFSLHETFRQAEKILMKIKTEHSPTILSIFKNVEIEQNLLEAVSLHMKRLSSFISSFFYRCSSFFNIVFVRLIAR